MACTWTRWGGGVATMLSSWGETATTLPLLNYKNNDELCFGVLSITVIPTSVDNVVIIG